MKTTTKLLGVLAVATFFGSFGCAGAVQEQAPNTGRSLADVSPELLQAAQGQQPEEVEVEWEDDRPEKEEATITAHTRSARTQTFVKSRKNQIFAVPVDDSPTGFTK